MQPGVKFPQKYALRRNVWMNTPIAVPSLKSWAHVTRVRADDSRIPSMEFQGLVMWHMKRANVLRPQRLKINRRS